MNYSILTVCCIELNVCSLKSFFFLLKSHKSFSVSLQLQLKSHKTNTVQENADKRHTTANHEKARRPTSARHYELRNYLSQLIETETHRLLCTLSQG